MSLLVACPPPVNTIAVVCSIPAFDQETFLAAVDGAALNGIWQEDDRVTLYVAADDWTDARDARLRQWLVAHGYTADDVTVRPEPAKNWNAAWEETRTSIRVGDFVLCPTTADPPAAGIPLWIDPEMSFGTGHHASTRLALRLLPDAVRPGNRVLDAGTGTGVLALAACETGARSVVAFDTHPPAIDNARANARHNGWADAITVRHGSLDVVSEQDFDVILANITREVLRSMLPGFSDRLRPGGALVLAGLFSSDRECMLRDTARHGFSLAAERTENSWWAARFIADSF